MTGSIGGYFSLELNKAIAYPHKKALHLQSARSALKIILQSHDIKSLYTPYFTCPTLLDTIKDAGCGIRFYSINEDFSPIISASEKEWILYTDYFGINGDNVKNMLRAYKNIIIDNAQSFFATPSRICFYSPRKFIGVSDGGLLYDDRFPQNLAKDSSLERLAFLLKRLEFGAEAGYKDFLNAEKSLDSAPRLLMSNITRKILHSINYRRIKRVRIDNFLTLKDMLAKRNALLDSAKLHSVNARLDSAKLDSVPMVYPYYADNKLRQFLIKQKIFVPTYWANMNKWCDKSLELDLSQNLIPLPIDQRYGKREMKYIARAVEMYYER